ncbi:MAG: carboxypeptidase regulatory-like domain-containing protein [Thermoanaerobaculia bacterium]
MERKGWRGAGILALALLFASGIAFGQAQTGNIFARASDEQGAGLPGVNVTLSGVSAPISQVTNVNGDVRFLSLSPATYALDFSLQGFAKVSRKNVTVGVGANTQINVTMKLSGVQESVVVTGESPLLDKRATGASQQVTKVELENVPTARDPWVILQTAPGVQIDRVNVGGSESGQQSTYVGKGATLDQGTWNVDGVNITDMGALGSSPTYYDFDSFAEMNITTGGSDASIQTPGVQLNMVTKRGTNDVHGSARVIVSDKALQSDNISEELAAQLARDGLPVRGNQLNSLQDFGAELGGPIVKDKVWLWGSYGRQQINNITAAGYPDNTQLIGFGGKLNAQIVPENSFTADYSYNDKRKQGRNASPTRPPETTWDQTGPTKLYKLEDSHVFGSDVFATVSYARILGGFNLVSEGQGQPFLDDSGIWHNGFVNYYTQRPQTQVTFTPSFFLRTGNIGHEIKAGFNYRDTPIASQSSWPGGIIAYSAGAYGTSSDVVAFTRDRNQQSEQLYYSGFVSDTMTVDKLTVNLGVRYDYQKATDTSIPIPCCSYNTSLYPQVPFKPITYQGSPPVIWKDFQPRVGLTYAIGPENKTLLKASYARFANQLGGTIQGAGGLFPSDGGVPHYLYYYWHDDGTHIVKPGLVDFTTDYGFGPNGIYGGYNLDPNNPNATMGPGRADPNLKAPKTDEFILGVEHEVLPAFVVGLSGTYRRTTDLLQYAPLSADGSRVLTPADYSCKQIGPYPVPGGSPQYVQQCDPLPGVAGQGRLLRNRPGEYLTYWGIDFSATKRYSDKWMARFNFTYSDDTQHGLADGVSDPSNLQPGTEADGGQFIQGAGTGSGAKQYVWLSSHWQATLSGMYTLPLDFNISTSVFGRQGYVAPYYRRVVSGAEPAYGLIKLYQLGAVDDERLPTVFEWDLGLSKVVTVGSLKVTLMADLFNVLNRDTVLQRVLRVRSTSTTTSSLDNEIYEQQAPRIVRFGARLAF